MSLKLPIDAPESKEQPPSELTQQEMASLTPAVKVSVMYERERSRLQSEIERLTVNLDNLTTHNAELIANDNVYKEEYRKNGALRLASIEKSVSFFFSVIFMAIGGGLISSFPSIEGVFPTPFIFGWALIICAIVFGLSSRVIVSLWAKLAKLK